MVILNRRLDQILRSNSFLYLVSSALLLGSAAFVFSWIAFPPFDRPITASPAVPLGCRVDAEGSWSIGIFYGDSPLSLKPIEDVSPEKKKGFVFFVFLTLNLNFEFLFWGLNWDWDLDSGMCGGTRARRGRWRIRCSPVCHQRTRGPRAILWPIPFSLFRFVL